MDNEKAHPEAAWSENAQRVLAASDRMLGPDLDLTEKKIAELLGGDAPFITELLDYAGSGGGKRIRPRLTILASRVFEEQAAFVLDIAATVELLHLATLLHDDVIDEAPLRRGKPAVQRRFGNRLSILGGDYLLTRVFHHLAHRVRNWDVYDAVLAAANRMVAGEFFEIWWENRLDLREEDYLHLITLKSAKLLDASCRVGGMAGGGDGAVLGALGTYGLNAGISFQITDDWLDFSAAAAELGKESYADVREGKVTLPLIYALKSPRGDAVAAAVESIWDGAAPAETALAGLLLETGALEQARLAARGYAEAGKQALAAVPAGEARDMLAELADWTWQRPY